MNLRTDLIDEQRELLNSNLSGVILKERRLGVCSLSETIITDDNAAVLLKKKKGRYFTLSFPRLDGLCDTQDIKEALKFALNILLPKSDQSIMVVGLGNTDITPDALGPFCANQIVATRHLDEEIKKKFQLEGLKSVSILIPGVLGKTGIEASQTVLATTRITNAKALIVIDSLATADIKRLCTTIQLSDTGISPGSGVNNSRKELSKEALGIPVIAIGMPTVVDAFMDDKNSLMVTPKEIDLLIRLASKLLSDTINEYLQPNLDKDILSALS